MRIVLDYGGTVVDEVDESKYSNVLERREGSIPNAGYIAYKAFSLGIIQSEEDYLDLVVNLTGLERKDCVEYLEGRKKAQSMPDKRKKALKELSDSHTLILFTDQVRPWIDESLQRFEINHLFDEKIVSSDIGYEKPHPKGYLIAKDDGDTVMVSDELNDDLLMADYFDMVTVWIENDYEEIHQEPDYRLDDLYELPSIIQDIE